MKYIVTLFLILITLAPAQKRYLVSPNNEAFPINPNETAAQVMKNLLSEKAPKSAALCDNATFGYDPIHFTPNSQFTAAHKDALAMWFIAPATGTIDTFYWFGGSINGALDSLVFFRIHRSRITPTDGPGVTYPYGCQNWGYWYNSNDLDQQVGAFPEDATDTTWISTMKSPYVTFPPMSDEIWGSGGMPAISHPFAINSIDLSILDKPIVQKNDVFWVSLRMNSIPQPSELGGDQTTFLNLDNNGGAAVPSRAWKFYEHDRGPSYCGGEATPKRGWIARGGPTGDSTSSYAWSWWYSMTVTTDLPPTITEPTPLTHTTSSSARQVVVEIEDCNAERPDSAGVASAKVLFSLNHGSTWDSVSMSLIGGNSWRGNLPGLTGTATMTYKITAYDLTGNRTVTSERSYRTFPLQNQYYSLDTNATYNWQSINTLGEKLTDWFDRSPFASTLPQDNGTAGPIDIGFAFPFFGDTVRYAWVGVNGALTLSVDESDTIDVYPDILHCNEGTATLPSNCNPQNYVAPFVYDFTVWPALPDGQGHGAVFYQNEPTKFIVEWYKVGNYNDIGDSLTTFEIILDKTDSSITFQYQNMGIDGIEYNAFAGLQKDNTSKWFATHILGSPAELKPRNNKAYKFTPVAPLGVNDEHLTLPVATTLMQNYPNPFNPTTDIHYTISDVGTRRTVYTRLKIYNVLGNEVATLVNEVKSLGEYTAHWDASSFPSGVYYYRLQAGNYVQTRKMLLTK